MHNPGAKDLSLLTGRLSGPIRDGAIETSIVPPSTSTSKNGLSGPIRDGAIETTSCGMLLLGSMIGLSGPIRDGAIETVQAINQLGDNRIGCPDLFAMARLKLKARLRARRSAQAVRTYSRWRD